MSHASEPVHYGVDCPLAVSANEAAEMIGVSTRTLWSLTRRGELPSCRVGRRVVYRVVDLQEFLAARARREGGAA